MGYILLGIFLAPFLMIVAYSALVVTFQILVMIYTQAFSLMGWDAPERYVRDNWGM